MSLFPAYSGARTVSQPPASGSSDSSSDSGSELSSAPPKDLSWLANSSFTPGSSTQPEGEERKKKRKSKKKRKKGDREGITEMTGEVEAGNSGADSCCFVFDRTGDASNLEPTPAQPKPLGPLKWDKSTRERIKSGKRKKRKGKRKAVGRAAEGRYFSRAEPGRHLEKISEEELTKRTEVYNRQLSEDPSNVQLWIEYIQLQDLGGGKSRGIEEKKLLIVEKALSENPGDELLLNLKFSIAEKILPHDKIVEEARKVTKRDRGSLTGWRWLLQSTQWNLSHMVVPSVLTLYSQALNALHSKHSEHTIDLLYDCMLFLRQGGMWELLTRLLETYLQLNLSSQSSFRQDVHLPLQHIRELEDGILKSGLPLGALWLRLEHLREGVHFNWTDETEETEDPGRVVTAEEVAPLALPLPLPPHFPPLVLKLPPLPHSHAFASLLPTSWIESSEPLLAATLHTGFVHIDVGYLEAAKEVLVSPQWVKEKTGRGEFFKYVDGVLGGCEGELVQVWRVRWWRWLGQAKLKEAKKLLKEHPLCLPLYLEYALLSPRPLEVLYTAIKLNKAPLHDSSPARHHVTFLYLTTVHQLLYQDFQANREKALKVLVGLALGQTNLDSVQLTEERIEMACEKMKHVSLEVEEEFEPLDEVRGLEEVMVPLHCVSWLACHSLLLYLHTSVWEAASLLQSAVERLQGKLEGDSPLLGRVVLEGYYESLVQLLHHFTRASPGHTGPLTETLDSAAKLFPNNLYFMKVHADITMKCGWKAASAESLLSKLYSVFTLRHRLTSSTDHSSWCRVERQLREVLYESTREGVGERSGLAWRLLLEYLSSFQPDHLKQAFHQAIEHCPWVKSVYSEGGELMSHEVAAIQDLVVEKELRLHITTEEIEILRQDSPS